MVELVIPDYQINLIRQKPNYGVKLTEEEENLISTSSETPNNEFFNYLQKVYPKRFEEIVLNTKIAPIPNYRENYKAAQLLAKAYSSGFIKDLKESEELKYFKNHYFKYNFFNGLRFYGGLFGLFHINATFLIPRFKNIPILLFQNSALLLGWLFGLNPIVENFRRKVIPYQDKAARLYKNELFELHSRHDLIYQYENVLEEFPPDAHYNDNIQFLISKGLYEDAHKNDFDGMGRRKSPYILYKGRERKLV